VPAITSNTTVPNNGSVFISGATGLLGSHVVRELIKRTYRVKAFVEPSTNTSTIIGFSDLEICYGNILDPEAVVRASKGCDYIIHVAASTSVFPSRNKLVKEVNVTGTKNIIEAALKNGIKRMIHVGSANTFGYNTINLPGNETVPFCCGKFKLDYIESKYEAHQEVIHAVRKRNLPAIIVCPTFMLGKYDSKLGSGALVASIYNNSLPGYTKGGKNYVHANDVAIAIVNALNKGKIGESYILGHQNLNYKEAFELIAKTIGCKAPSVCLPKWLTVFYGATNELICKTIGKTPKVTLAIARIGNEGFYYDSSKAVRELEMPQTPIDVAVRDCFLWLKENNLLNK
jgi:dihydroflavonol-4-reductase